MINEITLDDGGMYHVETSHGTYYLIDLDEQMGMRMPAPDRNPMRADGKWFFIDGMDCKVGRSMALFCTGIAREDVYTWRMSTEVVSITKVLEEESD